MTRFFKTRDAVQSLQRKYNRIHHFYGLVEKHLDQTIDRIVREKIAVIENAASCSALEYACGSGLLTLKLAPHFSSITGRDLSSGMLARARKRAGGRFATVAFKEGNLLAVDEPPQSYDYVFVSFALHLFSAPQVKQILAGLCQVARHSVIIIDHGKQWQLGTAVVEWFEGSHYRQYLKIDFRKIAREIGCRAFEETIIEECAVMNFGSVAITQQA